MKQRRLLILLFFFLGILCAYSQINKGLISAYYFSGNANDTLAHNDGTVRGASLTYDRFGNPNSAYDFHGIDDYITLGTTTELRQYCMSISIWVKINNYKATSLNYHAMPLISTRARNSDQYHEAYVISIIDGNHKMAGSTNSLIQEQATVIARTPTEIDKWTHVVYMFDTDTIHLYVNGVLQNKNYKGFYTNYAAGDSVVLGYVGNLKPDSYINSNHSWLNGCLDDIKFYNRILTSSEVLELYKEPNLSSIVKSESDPGNVGTLFKRFWYILVLAGLIIFLVIFIVRWRLYYIRKKERAEMDLQQKFAQMEMKALRSQMNPHFIFNAINSIQHYVLTNEKELANKYLVKFSQLMRNILDLSKQELINLKDELETINLYLDIEALRFNNAFSYKINVGEGVYPHDIRLPPLLIQPFVENAIWHGLLLKEGEKRLSINVFKKENSLWIEIDDNGIGRKTAEKFRNRELKRRSFGMDITQDRLTVLEKVFGINISFEIFDKMNDQEESLGTTVFIEVKN